jgi:hypothetical protein
LIRLKTLSVESITGLKPIGIYTSRRKSFVLVVVLLLVLENKRQNPRTMTMTRTRTRRTPAVAGDGNRIIFLGAYED